MRYRLRHLLVAASLLGTSLAQSPLFTLVPGNLDADGFPTSGAKVCLTGDHPTCYPMVSLTRDNTTYEFGLDPHAEAIAAPGPGPWLLFSATFSGGGSGTLTRYEIIRSEGTYLVGVLHNVALTNASGHAIWHEPKLSPYPLFVSADFVWSKGETHFSHHFYTIEVSRYDPAEREYFPVLTYRTRKKYKSLDDSDTINVIAPERAEILRRLRALKPTS